MTPEKAGELAKILQAVSEDKVIQKSIDGEKWTDYWVGIDSVFYEDILSKVQFRIKPERKKVQLTMQDLIERRKLGFEYILVRHKEFDGEHLITDIMIDGVCVKGTYYKYSDLMAYYTFLNNDPCYKEVDCE